MAVDCLQPCSSPATFGATAYLIKIYPDQGHVFRGLALDAMRRVAQFFRTYLHQSRVNG